MGSKGREEGLQEYNHREWGKQNKQKKKFTMIYP